MRKQLILALFLGFLLFGCVEERTVNVSGYETIESISGMDLNADGINDVLTYSYRSIPIDQPAGISMARTVSAAPFSYEFIISSYNDNVDLPSAKAAIAEFDSARKQGETTCFSRLQLPTSACTDPNSCVQNCDSEYCAAAYKGAGDTLGRELLDFKDKSAEMDRIVAEINAIQTVPSQSDKEQFVRKVVRLMALSSDLSYNNIFNSRTYNLCAPLDLRLNKLNEAAQKAGSVQISADRYRYRVAEVVTGGTEDQYIFLFVQDTPPVILNIDELSVDIDGTIYQRIPLKLGWENVQLNTARKVFTYDFTSADAPQETVMARWSNPSVNERNVKFLGFFNAIYSNPLISLILGFSKSIFTLFYSFGVGYYASLGAALSFILWAALFVIFLLTLLYHTLHAYIDRKVIKDYLVEEMGPPLTDWKNYIGMGALLIFLCLVLGAIYVRPVEMGEFDLATIQLRLTEDIIGSVTMVMFIFGAYTIYLVAEDRLKGLILGESYYHVKGATKEENLNAISKLKVLTGNLKSRVETLSRVGMDVKEEYAILIAVPVDRLEQLIDLGKQNTAKSLIDFHMERIEATDKSLEQKVRIMEENWPVWNSEIEKALDQSQEVPVETLVSIPLQWREWAVSKFISEHRGKSLVLEDNRIKRRKVSMENLVNTSLTDMHRSGLVDTSIVMQGSKVISNTFSKGNMTVGAALFLKLVSYSKAISKKFGEDDVRRVVVMGKKSAAAYLPDGNTSPLLFTDRLRLKDLIEDWKKRIGEAG